MPKVVSSPVFFPLFFFLFVAFFGGFSSCFLVDFLVELPLARFGGCFVFRLYVGCGCCACLLAFEYGIQQPLAGSHHPC